MAAEKAELGANISISGRFCKFSLLFLALGFRCCELHQEMES